MQAKNKLFSFRECWLTPCKPWQELTSHVLHRSQLSMFIVQTKTTHLKQYFIFILSVTCSPEHYSQKLKTKSQISIARTSVHEYLHTHSVRRNPVQPLRYASTVRTCHNKCIFLVHNVQLLSLKLYSHEQNNGMQKNALSDNAEVMEVVYSTV